MDKALENLIRDHYRALQGYVSAGMESGKDETKIFMNANENPFELPGLEGLNRYPEPQPKALAEAYAGTYGVKPEQILMTRGADEALDLLTEIFCEPHQDAVIIHPPTFGMYQVNAASMPAEVIEVPLLKKDGTFALDVDGMIEAAAKNVKIIYICTPNNPTGTSFPAEEVLKITEAVRGTSVVVVDETYREFSQEPSFTEVLADHPNLIVLRTLSKSYSLAGARMGVAIAQDEEFIALIKSKALDAYPLPKQSIEAALKALSQPLKDIAQQHIQTLLKERKRMEEALAASPLVAHIYPSDANFLLVELTDAKGFLSFCAENNVILRDLTSRVEGALRISVGTPEENDKVFELLNSFEFF